MPVKTEKALTHVSFCMSLSGVLEFMPHPPVRPSLFTEHKQIHTHAYMDYNETHVTKYPIHSINIHSELPQKKQKKKLNSHSSPQVEPLSYEMKLHNSVNNNSASCFIPSLIKLYDNFDGCMINKTKTKITIWLSGLNVLTIFLNL